MVYRLKEKDGCFRIVRIGSHICVRGDWSYFPDDSLRILTFNRTVLEWLGIYKKE